MKKHTDTISLPLIIEKILLEESDLNHLVTLDDIMVRLEEDYQTVYDRRSVYRAIKALNDNGRTVLYERKNNVRGYRIIHPLTSSEALICLNAIHDSPGLSQKETESLTAGIRAMLSRYDDAMIADFSTNPVKTDNENVVANIHILLQAISDNTIIEFSYYDISVTKQKQYRKKNQRYHLAPYAIVSSGGRYYCIFHDEKHQSFANYRIDKMDRLVNTGISFDPVPFNLESHLNASFQMYHGVMESVTLKIDLELASIVFDQFGRDIIISEVEDTSFTATIRTAVTPTLISWILMFEKHITVLRPNSLIEEITELAGAIQKKYR